MLATLLVRGISAPVALEANRVAIITLAFGYIVADVVIDRFWRAIFITPMAPAVLVRAGADVDRGWAGAAGKREAYAAQQRWG
ncbi:MAG: hypothetical protein GPOALKHO_001426 [Sodalis sp.]|uniref:hypothetical protein n=1 Tax=Sodalis sp. (in: enterobacteria) TaxID=1898979 RepID=UPI003873484B|nr:MAG: hypothetical protein GPOALKHO_001426 [Sodalis sp.]